MNMKNKTILITGASSGIGKACATTFAEHGAKLLLCARRLDRIQTLAKELENQYHIETHTFQLDVTQRQDVKNQIDSLPDEWQNIDVLINNAGLAAGLSSVQAGDIDDWEQMIDTNIKGLLYVTRNVLPMMLQRDQGHIINIGSIAGHEVYPNGAVYCATKHAVKAINEGIKKDVHGSKIRVTAIDPGMVETEFSLVRFKGDKDKAETAYKGMTPLQAQDIADAVYYCASRPPHVNVSDMIILATDQSGATMVHRQT